MVSELKIKTPEGIVFSFLLAGPVTRLLAWLVDFICIVALLMLIQRVVLVLALISADFAGAFSTIGYFAVSIGYGILTEWYWRGQTVGKKVLRLRVMDEQGLRLRFSQIAIRNLLRFVDMLPSFYVVGGLACFFSRRAQRLGDFAANTIVVRNPKILEPDLDQLALGKFNSLRRYPHLEARLRQRVSPEEARLTLQALVRRDEFDPAARVELFGELAAHFKSLVAFPHEVTEAIADEQYIRNVVDILFRTRGTPERAGTQSA
jgi:uncharacterized RDD family membrane protein YckC